MLLRNNSFHFEKPANFDKIPVSKLMKGLMFDFHDPYIPFFTPIGTSMLTSIENVFRKNLEEVNCYEVRIPLIMDTDWLNLGQEVGSLFERKIMRLSGRMEKYHLMTTPEMVFINLFSKNSIDSSSLPINYYYVSNIFRDMPDPKNILRTKQIRIVGGVSIDSSADARQQTEDTITGALYKSFSDFQFPFHQERFANGASSEFFYLNSKENETYMIPSIDSKNKTKSISLGMIYDYSAECPKDFLHINPYTHAKEKTFVTSYAIGVQRVMYVILDHFRDSKGFNLPANIRPCDVVFIANEQNMDVINKMANELAENNVNVYVDNVFGRAHTKRMDNADYIGAGLKVVGRDNNLSVFDRNGDLRAKSENPQEVVNRVFNLVKTQRTK